MKKRIIPVFLILCMTWVLLPTAARADSGGFIEDLNGKWHFLLPWGKEDAVSGEGWSWDGDGTLVLSGYTGKHLGPGYITHLVLKEGSVNTFETATLPCVADSPVLKIEGSGELIVTSGLSIVQDTGPVVLADNLQMTGGPKKGDSFPLTYDSGIRGLTISQIPKTMDGIESSYVRIAPASSGSPQKEADASAQPDKPSENKNVFSDVPSNAYYADAVTWAVKEGITAGTSAATFSPNATCTRGQIITFLWRASGSPEPAGAVSVNDVKPSDYYYKAVLWAAENGMSSGKEFSPNAPCTRAMAVEFLWRQAGKPASARNTNFTDVENGASYADAVSWAVTKGVTAGTSTTTFSPDAACTRGQIVTFLYRDMA